MVLDIVFSTFANIFLVSDQFFSVVFLLLGKILSLEGCHTVDRKRGWRGGRVVVDTSIHCVILFVLLSTA
jgi:hypothetical protein